MISINPDAHNKTGLKDMQFCILVARKGGLIKGMFFNALGLEEIGSYFLGKRK